MSDSPPDQPNIAARITIIAALITATATLAAALIGYVANVKSNQATSVINNINSGIQFFGDVVMGQKSLPKNPVIDDNSPVAIGEQKTRGVPLNVVAHFDSDVSVAIQQYDTSNKWVLMAINGPPLSVGRKPGDWVEAKKNATKVCYVQLLNLPEATPNGGIPTFNIEYFCQSPK